MWYYLSAYGCRIGIEFDKESCMQLNYNDALDALMRYLQLVDIETGNVDHIANGFRIDVTGPRNKSGIYEVTYHDNDWNVVKLEES